MVIDGPREMLTPPHEKMMSLLFLLYSLRHPLPHVEPRAASHKIRAASHKIRAALSTRTCSPEVFAHHRIENEAGQGLLLSLRGACANVRAPQ